MRVQSKNQSSLFNQPQLGDWEVTWHEACSSHDSISGKAPLLRLVALEQMDLVIRSIAYWVMTHCTIVQKSALWLA